MEQALRRGAKGLFTIGDVFSGDWPGPRVLIYHQVTTAPRRQLDLDPKVFETQVDWLAKNGRVVSLDAILAGPDRSDSASDFVVTFDDGFKGLYRYAYPVLLDRGIEFTLYITTKMVEAASSGKDDEMLTWEEVNEMVSSGLMTVGAHTHTHPDLRDLDESTAREEIRVSNEIIEGRTGIVPRHFAYPKGYWSATAEPVVREEYASAVLGAGSPITKNSDVHRLGRVAVQRADGNFFFRRKMKTGLQWEEAVRSRLKEYSNPPAMAERP